MGTMVLGGGFTAPVDTSKLGVLLKNRLVDAEVVHPQVSVRLVSYMAWPHDETARNSWIAAHGFCAEIAMPNESHWARAVKTPGDFSKRLMLIQKHWARVADILHHHYDLSHGRHQLRRSGASIGKSIHIVAANAKSAGTGATKLWEIWAAYKDVAHLVTSAILVSAEAKSRGFSHLQIQPLRMSMLVPELVLAVALRFQQYGLGAKVHGREEPLFDPTTLWRIPENIGLNSVEPPVRQIRSSAVKLLNARRAGHRGKGKGQFKATSVSGQKLDN
jgi:hypothetical protein